MTRREKELFSRAIMFACNVQNVPLDDGVGMNRVAREIADHLTFDVSHAEIIAACAVNLAGKGKRRCVPDSDLLYRLQRGNS